MIYKGRVFMVVSPGAPSINFCYVYAEGPKQVKTVIYRWRPGEGISSMKKNFNILAFKEFIFSTCFHVVFEIEEQQLTKMLLTDKPPMKIYYLRDDEEKLLDI